VILRTLSIVRDDLAGIAEGVLKGVSFCNLKAEEAADERQEKSWNPHKIPLI
jgi:hypothetical protein